MACCFEVILSIFLMAGVGYFLKKIGFWGANEGTVFSKTVLYVTLPCFILLALAGAKLTSEAIIMPLIFIAGSLLSGLVSFLIAHFSKMSKPAVGTFILASSVGNTGFLGYPVILGVFGNKGLPWAAIIDQFGMALPLNTLGIAVASYYGNPSDKGNRAMMLLKSPPFIASLIALFLIGRQIPDFLRPLWRSMELFKDATVPLIMLFLGISLRPSSLNRRWAPIVMATFLKLFFQPVIIYALALRAGLSSLPFQVLIMQACMPTALLTVVFSENYQLDLELATGIVFLTTIASIFTIPFMSQVLSAR